jgi:hypothetical protein
MDPVTTSALRDLQRNTEEAAALAADEAVAGERSEPDPNAELVSELQSLRRQLAELTQQQAQAAGGNQQGQQPGQGQNQQNGQQPGGQQPGQQPGQGQQGGQQGGQQTAGGAQGGGQLDNRGGFGPGGPGGWYDPRRGGVWDPRAGGFWQNPETIEQAREQLQDASRELLTLGNRLREDGLTDEELQAVRDLGDALRGGITGNPELIEQEFQRLVNLTEQLELKLAAGDTAERSAVRAEAPTPVAPGYEEAVAEYFRRLSRTQPQ